MLSSYKNDKKIQIYKAFLFQHQQDMKRKAATVDVHQTSNAGL